VAAQKHVPHPPLPRLPDKSCPTDEDFDNMTAYLRLPEVTTATLNVYGVFIFTDLPWGNYLVTVHHPQRDFTPQYAHVTISPDEPYAVVEYAAAEATDFGQLTGYTWRYDPVTGYDGIHGVNVLIELIGFEDSWTRITKGYGWFGIGGLETPRYYRVTPTRADMQFTPDSRVVFLGGGAIADPLFLKVLEDE
jgi:hypothetical protein